MKLPPEEKIRRLLQNQKLAVLGTQEEGRPYANLVAFVPTEDLRHIILATAKHTRKYANIKANPHVSLLIDNRDNMESDFHRGMAVTALGVAEELKGTKRARYLKSYRERHPYLDEFVASPTLGLFIVTVETYYLVTEFQNVVTLKMDS